MPDRLPQSFLIAMGNGWGAVVRLPDNSTAD